MKKAEGILKLAVDISSFLFYAFISFFYIFSSVELDLPTFQPLPSVLLQFFCALDIADLHCGYFTFWLDCISLGEGRK